VSKPHRLTDECLYNVMVNRQLKTNEWRCMEEGFEVIEYKPVDYKPSQPHISNSEDEDEDEELSDEQRRSAPCL
jgi:hypothetical protein